MKKKVTNLCKELTLEEVVQDRADLMSDEQLYLLEKKISDEKLRRRNLKIVEENLKIEEQHSMLLERVDSLLSFVTEHNEGCDVTKEQESNMNNLSFDPWKLDQYDCQYERNYTDGVYAKCTRCALLAIKNANYNSMFGAEIKVVLKDLKLLQN